jgi:hypothetical protein
LLIGGYSFRNPGRWLVVDERSQKYSHTICTEIEATKDMSKMVDVASHIRRIDRVDESQRMVQSRLSLGMYLGIPYTTIWGPSNNLLNRRL